MKLFKKIRLQTYLYLLGASIGAIIGYEYYNYVSCSSGACMMTSNPYIMTTYGAIIGATMMNLLEPVILKIRTKLKNDGKN